MIYLIPMFDCSIFSGEFFQLKKGAKYKIVEKGNNCGIVFGKGEEIPYLIDLENENTNILKVKYQGNKFMFLFPFTIQNCFSTKFMFKSKEVEVNLFKNLKISLDRLLICEENVENLKYSHHEIVDDLCLIFFEGERNYLVVLQDKEIKFSNYYDEFNNSESEKYFMMKMNDSLNHGIVCHIVDGKCEIYSVYLDEEELELKQEFVPFVFLDCVKAKNFKYCNELLIDKLKMNDHKQIKEFFPDFDYFYPLGEKQFMLAKKNTLAGIYSFELENNKISNIRCL